MTLVTAVINMRRQLILNVAALSPRELGEHTPNLNRIAAQGSLSPLRAPDPALTSVSHATMLTGLSPREHGIVANGWYDRNYAKIHNWNRSDKLIEGERLWEAARAREPKIKCANLFWRYCTHASCDFVLTERPTYFANGRKGADVYSPQGHLKRSLVAQHGPFPFFNFWGPKASMKSSEWIVAVTKDLLATKDYDLVLCYAPGLDYDGQRFGPESTEAMRSLMAGDQLFGDLADHATSLGYDVSIVSDYGFTSVSEPIMINRVLRDAGLLSVEVAANGELLEPGDSKAFAVTDNQAAHVYINDQSVRSQVISLLSSLEGVAEVLDASSSEALGHERSGDLLAVSDSRHWFAYPYWLDESLAPDFARCVDIFSKPGFDPCEMFMRAGLGGKLHVAKRFLQLKTGIRAPFDVIENDPHLIRGARNIRPSSADQNATLITSWRREQSTGEVISMRHLKHLLIDRMFGSN